jgi:hypothetical protein
MLVGENRILSINPLTISAAELCQHVSTILGNAQSIGQGDNSATWLSFMFFPILLKLKKNENLSSKIIYRRDRLTRNSTRLSNELVVLVVLIPDHERL